MPAYRHPGKWTKRERSAAHTTVSAAVRLGILVRPNSCSRCNCSDRAVIAHHDQYDEPLNVIWLCTTCHSVRHMELAEEAGIDVPHLHAIKAKVRFDS